MLRQRYLLFGLVLAEMEVGVKFIEIWEVKFKLACKHSGAQLKGLFIRQAKSI